EGGGVRGRRLRGAEAGRAIDTEPGGPATEDQAPGDVAPAGASRYPTTAHRPDRRARSTRLRTGLPSRAATSVTTTAAASAIAASRTTTSEASRPRPGWPAYAARLAATNA